MGGYVVLSSGLSLWQLYWGQGVLVGDCIWSRPFGGQALCFQLCGVKEGVCVFIPDGSFLPETAHLLEKDVSSGVPGSHQNQSSVFFGFQNTGKKSLLPKWKGTKSAWRRSFVGDTSQVPQSLWQMQQEHSCLNMPCQGSVGS